MPCRTRTSSVLSALFALGLVVVGHTARDIRLFGSQSDDPWVRKVSGLVYRALPDLEPESTVYDHVGHSAGFRMIRDFNHLVTTMYETYQFHFELLNIGYAAYLTFFGMCKNAFPDISDQSISRMVGGLDVELYRPDDELKRLAK